MSQGFNPNLPIEDSPLSSTEMRTLLNAINSAHAGTTEPSYPTPGMVWLDTTGNKAFKVYNGVEWTVVFTFDLSGVVVFDGGSFS